MTLVVFMRVLSKRSIQFFLFHFQQRLEIPRVGPNFGFHIPQRLELERILDFTFNKDWSSTEKEFFCNRFALPCLLPPAHNLQKVTN